MYKNQKGFTLTELIAGIVLVTLLFTGFTIFYMQFLKGLFEMREFNQLQEDVLYTFESMRHGYAKKNINDKKGLIGLLTAQTVAISTNNSAVTITPIITDTGSRYWAKYSLDNEGRILLNAQYGLYHISNQVIFPSSSEKVGREYKYQVTNFKISNLTSGGNFVKLVRIKIDAEVRYRQRGLDQNRVEDQKQNIGNVSFETVVYIDNAKDI